MAQPVIQTSFNSGEWTPSLNARVDLAKYHSGAALLRNFFVDYRGGATTRPGTKYILQAKSNSTVRLIPFQASFTVAYILEFGTNYIRFYNNGAPVLEATKTISAITKANPGVVTSASHGYSNGDWVYLLTAGMTQLNMNYYIVAGATTNTFTLTDLNGVAINTTGFGTFTSGTAQRVYTVATTYAASELFGIKYAQDVNILVLCHPNHAPAQLVLNTSNTQPSWTFSSITFGSTIAAPTVNSITTNLAAGAQNLAYRITAVDANGQESTPTAQPLNAVADFFAGGNVTIVLNPVTGAVGYNFYRSIESGQGAIPAGVPFGFIGTTTSVTFVDSNLNLADFSQTPPVVQNPFSGTGVASVTITSGGTYTPGAVPIAIPTVAFSGGGGSGASGLVFMGASAIAITNAGAGYRAGFVYTLGTAGSTVTIMVDTIQLGGLILTAHIVSAGSFTGTIPGNAVNVIGDSSVTATAQVNVSYQVTSVGLVSPGTGYGSAPSVAFSYGSATATSAIGTPSAGNPTVPAFIQQRMFLGGLTGSPSQFNMSQPTGIYNFNITFPPQDDNAIQETLTNTTLNSIKSATPVSAGLVILADKGAWLVNGGSLGSGIGALSIVANPQSYSGASDLPPILTPNDLIYVQSKGSIVRDLSYNYYMQNYVGADISVLSSHLFYTYTITQWAWAEEPFKVVWATRNDGILLSLTFVKEQELIAWAHSDTQGTFKSVATVTEQVSIGSVDAIYVVVNRTINGNNVNYIERMVELYYPQDYQSSWQVDAGISYSGAPATTFTGATHLASTVVTGVADGVVINLTVAADGSFTLGTAASLVTIGLGFTAQLQTLQLDLGEPTVQSKEKKITDVTLRCKDTLGLTIGTTFDVSVQVPVDDLVLGNVGKMSNAVVTGLVTADAMQALDPAWTVPGQYCIQQTNPYPASILGVIPRIVVGDNPK